MILDEETINFIDSPDTGDFAVRRSEYFTQIVEDRDDILYTQILGGRYSIAYYNVENFREIINEIGTSGYTSVPNILGLLDRASLEASGIIQVQNQPYLDLSGQGVLIGFVDTGIDYRNPSFIYEDGTSKIKYIFDQTERNSKGLTPPEDFYFGTEYNQQQINEALKAENPLEIVPQVDTVGHGTFLASVAAGRSYEGNLGAAPNSELIVVKLREAREIYRDLYLVPPSQRNAYESTDVMIGIEYILMKARELNRPVSICIALGSNFGSHDGSSILEEYISSVSNLRGVCISTAAGNESQAKHHTQGRLTNQGETQNIDINVGNNAGDFYLTIINVASDRLSVSVRSPTGEVVGRFPAKSGLSNEARLILEKATVLVEYFFPIEGNGGQMTIIKILNATPGIWTVIVHGDIVLDGNYHSWLPLTGFVSPSVEYLSATPYYTVVIPSTAYGSITCGAYNSNNNTLYTNTSWGPTNIPLISPDLVAPGVNVGGFYPTGEGTMSGTSVSTCITAGASALFLQWGVVDGNDYSMSTYQIRAYLIRGCTRSESIVYPNNQWGFGRLNLFQSFNLMREL